MARRLDGSERGLDALVGVVILAAEFLIGFIALTALYDFGTNPPVPLNGDAVNAGFSIAVLGSLAAVAVTTLIYLVRIAIGRRSWTSPLWGTILMTVALVVGYFVMTSGA